MDSIEMEVEQRSQEIPFQFEVNMEEENHIPVIPNEVMEQFEERLSQVVQNATQFYFEDNEEEIIAIAEENREMEVEQRSQDLPLVDHNYLNNETNNDIAIRAQRSQGVEDIRQLINMNIERLIANAEENVEREVAEDIQPNLEYAVNPREADVDETARDVNEERSAKKPKISNDNSAANAQDADKNLLEDEEDCCPICYAPYSNMGDHRLSCLKCGHIFGFSCINHWLRVGCPANGRRCPSCNKKAALKDIRILYAKNLIALDTTERDRLQETLNLISTEKNKIEAKLNAAELKAQMQDREITTLKECIAHLQQSRPSIVDDTINIDHSKEGARLEHFKDIEFKPSAGGRVLAFNEQYALLVASHSTSNEMLPTAGIRTINAHYLCSNQYQQIHKKPIRDMRFSNRDPKILLTVSLDNTAKLYDITNNVVVQTYTAPSSLWSCCWCENEPYKFYCGGQTGTIVSYDQRKGNKELEKISNFECRFPVISLASLPAKAGRVLPQGGLIVCRLNNVYVINDGVCHSLPLEGPFVSMRYESGTDRILLSTRPSDKHDARHIYGQFSLSNGNNNNNNNVCDVIHTINNGRCGEVLSRSNFLNSQNGEKLVCAYNAGNKKIDIFNGGTGNWLNIKDNKMMTEPVLDICPFYINKEQYVPCISNTRVALLKLIL